MTRKAAERPRLDRVSVLLVDDDPRMAELLVSILHFMGFSNIRQAPDSDSALSAMRHQEVDLLITDWQARPMNGIDITRGLRTGDNPGNRTLPIVMLTARSERKDVEAARDVGVTEFALKPYSSKTLFEQLRQIVDNPRSFIVSPTYVGPDRRRRNVPRPGVPERRLSKPRVIKAVAEHDYDEPRIVPPDYTLRQKIGLNGSLATIIPPALVDEAQKIITDKQDMSFDWIRADIEALERAYHDIRQGSSQALDSFVDSTLSIKSRAGTFGYRTVSDVAMLLYRFLRNDYQPGEAAHNTVVLKHVQMLKVLRGQPKGGEGGALEQEVVRELQLLAGKYRYSS